MARRTTGGNRNRRGGNGGNSNNGGNRAPSRGRFARNSADAQARAAANRGRRRVREDDYTPRAGRIRDEGQAIPKGYMRTGGRYFAKIANMRPIRSQTTEAQRAHVYSNRERYWGVNGDAGYLASVGRQGMYNGETGEANFRKTTAARRVIDDAFKNKRRGGGAGATTRARKSRYIISFGQDGHMR